jgi:Polyketide cyclase / dehydrase and lipid transport
MSDFALEEWIDAPPQVVFQIMTNPQRAPQINDKIVEMKPLTAGSLAAGTRYREKRLVNGQEAQTELTVESYDPPNTYAVSAAQSGVKVLYTYSLTAENGGTAVRLLCDISSSGLKKLMVPVVASIMKREDGDHLANLKKVVEQQ